MMAQPNPKLNHLLSVLPPEEWSRIVPELALVDMPLGHVVYESGDRLDYVYFPPHPSCPCSMSWRMVRREKLRLSGTKG